MWLAGRLVKTFLYNVVRSSLLFRPTKQSRKGSLPSSSISLVNWMSVFCSLRWARARESYFNVSRQNCHCVSEYEAKSVVRVWYFDIFICIMCLFLHLFSKFLNKLHTVLRIIVVFHWIYRPFIHLKSFFFQNSKSFAREENIIYTFYLFGGKTERNEVSKWKHWKFNIAIEGMTIWQSTLALPPLTRLHLFRLNFCLLFYAPCIKHFPLSCNRKRKRFYMPLQELVVHFKSEKNL